MRVRTKNKWHWHWAPERHLYIDLYRSDMAVLRSTTIDALLLILRRANACFIYYMKYLKIYIKFAIIIHFSCFMMDIFFTQRIPERMAALTTYVRLPGSAQPAVP